jgi:beta-lactamase superfamily II metal-dependent hydrolase
MNGHVHQNTHQTLTLNHGKKITNEKISLGQGASMTFLFVDGSPRSSLNENSLAVRLDLGTHKILLMGDAEAGGRNLPSTVPIGSSIEGKLLACCTEELKADILVVGHHGSKTSSRKKFLDAVGAKTFIVSAGPTKYATVVLPDQEIIAELEKLGQVFRTDLEDASCLMSPDKVGSDSDGKPGGCDNVLVKIPANKSVSVDYRRISD